MAADHGLSKVIADTTMDNVASQRTLIRAGFRIVRTHGDLEDYEAVLDTGRSAAARVNQVAQPRPPLPFPVTGT